MSDLLLPAPPGQRLLFSPEIEEILNDAEEREGRYTGERFKERRPEAYAAAVQLLGAGLGLLKIGRLLGVHHMTIAAVRDREPEAIDIASQTIGRLDTAIALQLDRLLEHPGLVPMTHVGMLLDQLVRNRELLAGRATSRVERMDVQIDVHGDWDMVLQTFVSEKELPAHMVREIGFEPGKIAEIEPGDERTAEPDADGESEVHPRQPEPVLASNLANPTPDTDLNRPIEYQANDAGTCLRRVEPGAEGRGGDAPANSQPPDQT